jgi:hypothetical protein
MYDDAILINSVWLAECRRGGQSTMSRAYSRPLLPMNSPPSPPTGERWRLRRRQPAPQRLLQAAMPPERAFSTLDSTNPEDLWDWMDAQRAEAGYEAISIPHNSNVSDGQMFRLETYNGEPLDSRLCRTAHAQRAAGRGHPGQGHQSETHPDLSPNDEWANFEIYDRLLGVYDRVEDQGLLCARSLPQRS